MKAGIILTGFWLLVMYLLYKSPYSHNKQSSIWIRILRAGTITYDSLIIRVVDIMLCFPSFFLILTVVALLPGSIYTIMVVIGLTSWMGTTRFVRAEFLSLREQDFVTAAKALGIHDLRIIFRHMIPNAMAPVLVSATIGIASAIQTEAGLSFLGFGVPPPHATWGNILSDGKSFIFDAPWLTFIPGIAILIVVLSFNLFGEGLRDALNPKLRDR
jgi:peptide/nickel transport system permease protein